MNRGYIKLWRKSQDSGFLGNADVWQLLSWCLLNATHKPHKQLVGKQLVALEPGQLIFGRNAVAIQLNSTVQKIRTSLKTLENAQFLTVSATNKFSIITIVNWNSYQDEQPSNNQQVNTQATIKQPSSNHKQEQENKEQEEKKEEHTIVCLSPAEPDDEAASVDDHGIPPCPQQQIIAMYHELLPELSRVRRWEGQRPISLRARWRECLAALKKQGKPHGVDAGLAWWRAFFGRVRASPVLLGKIPIRGKPFFADLAWMLKPEKHTGIIEGKYLER